MFVNKFCKLFLFFLIALFSLYLVYEKLKEENNIKTDDFFHFDTPLTVANQIDALKKAGFKEVEIVTPAPTAILIAKK